MAKRRLFRSYRIWIIGILGGLIAATWIVAGSQSFQSCIQGYQPDYEDANFYKRAAVLRISTDNDLETCLSAFLEKNEPSITAASVLFTAIFTFVLAVSTIGLWKQTDRLAKGTEDTAIRQLRAYVSVKPAQLTEIRIGHVPNASFIMENTGQTPAYRLNHLAFVSVLPHPLLDGQGDLVAPHIGQKVPDFTLHSRSQTEGEASDDSALTADDFAKAMAGGDFRLYMAGMVQYDDAFGIGRNTKFCAYIEADELRRVLSAPPTPERPKETRITWIFSHVQNEST
jgi:hypothetical protein